jgi:beta-galactosidase/beta-glucuronidase
MPLSRLAAGSFVAVAVAALSLASSAAQWRPAPAPLTTPWADSVDPADTHPEYPRPQFVREKWIHLNGVWQFEEARREDPTPTGRDLAERILVPFPWESALSGIRRQLDSQRAHYRRTFEVPEDWRTGGQRVLLHFEAVDWEATVFVNGRFAGQHRGGYDPFGFDITPHLAADGPQEVVVTVFDPGSDQGIAVGKQNNARFADPQRYTYSPSSGIWLPVWMEPVPARYIDHHLAVPDIDAETLTVTVNADAHEEGLTTSLVVRNGSAEVARAKGALNVPVVLSIPAPRLWGPQDPFLYDLEIILEKDGLEIDRVSSYFGMRKISLGAARVNNRGPVMRLHLNNRFLFQYGPLDQGFWPDGLHTHPSDEALRWDVAGIRAWGFNMVRKHIKVESRRWFHHCDRAGLLVWQDMPSTFKLRTEEEKTQFELELMRMVRTHRNSPSIVNWVVFNEHWGAYDVERLTNFVVALDPSRLVTGNTGIDAGRPDVDYQVGHIKSNHSYRPPHAPHPAHNRATVNGEFGALGYLVEGHVWNPAGPWVHYNFEDSGKATEEYERFVGMLRGFKAEDALSGAVYTQWTDLESEMNGLYTYDRKVEKLDRARVTAANRSLWVEDLGPGSSAGRVPSFTNPTDGGAENTPDEGRRPPSPAAGP